MSENTKIEWCDHTFNPWEGCTKVSPGCTHCYAETRNHRFGGDNWGKGKPRRRTSKSNWNLPLKWNKEPRMEFEHRTRVFCASLADWLDDEVPIEWLSDLLKLIHDTSNLDWLLLTKRPENFKPRLVSVLSFWCERHAKAGYPNDSDQSKCHQALHNWVHSGFPPANVWIGVSVEDQKRADERIPELLKIPAKVRFLSAEPLLGPIDFTSHFLRANGGLHWVIFGGESGAGARSCNIEWIRVGGTQCRLYHIAPFVKQLGSVAVVPTKFCDGSTTDLCLNHSKGGDPAEWPEDLRVREFPK